MPTAEPITKVADQRNGLTFFQARKLADSVGRRLARNSEFDTFFSLYQGPPLTLSNNAWTETIVAYPPPKKALGDSVEWTDHRTGTRYYLDTKDFKGQKRVALVFEGCDMNADGGTMVFSPKSGVVVVESFPQESGFYARHGQTGLPFDDGTSRRPGYSDTRHLSRDNNRQWVGPLVRSYSRITRPDNLDHDIYAHFRPSLNFGVFFAGS
jgi:hypothetical protein